MWRKALSALLLAVMALNYGSPAWSQGFSISPAIEDSEPVPMCEQSKRARQYYLGPNDILSVSFLGVPELDQPNLRILPDGNLTIAPIGTIKAAGLTLDELDAIIRERGSFYLKSPKVSLNLVNTRPFIVYISGAVLNPGSYEINTDYTRAQFTNNLRRDLQLERRSPLLSNLLVAAGGIAYDADLEHVQIQNNTDGTVTEVNLLDLLGKDGACNDVYLTATDSIFVPRLANPLMVTEEKYKQYANATFSPEFVPVKVIGYVNRPGLVLLEPSKSLTLNAAISAAGGYLNQDSAPYPPEKVLIGRLDQNGNIVTREVDPMETDVTLMPNEVVYVPEKKRPMLGKAFDYMVRVLSPFNTFANTYNNWALMFNPQRFNVFRPSE